ncbi:hypothetical protein [Hymenobacter edaphi]|uniref:DUF4292 domain-containing protein n=1 Tax=Hymenobacter edaphi TaxID=2211146 RepID=A0A328BER8_9BACT|nr:hypothetical protein [Hymenobacter edaphi]RAK65229.1 hypothetical protein DLM85_16980 [Hymenobacter edaphi]
MRLSFVALAALAGLAACQTGQPDSERNPTTEASADTAAAATPAPAVAPAKLARQVSPLINGVWVKAAYLDALTRTRSPQAVARTPAAADITAFAIDVSRPRADSVAFDAILNNHEGGALQVYLRPGRRAQSLPVSYIDYNDEGSRYELSYGLQAGDTVLRLDKYDLQNRLRQSVPYRRIRFRPTNSPAEPALNQGLERAVRQAVLAGQYAGRDSVGRPVQVQLAADGRVTGLPPFHSYDVSIDFIGPESNLNTLLFNPYSAQQRTLAYRLSRDTLRLYAVRPDAEHINLQPARLHYTLVRRR